MKIVDKKTFLTYPVGTVYCEYEPCVFRSLCIKSTTWGSDFLYEDLMGAVVSDSCGDEIDVLDEAQRTGASVTLEYGVLGRDGMYDDKQLFAVYEPQDVNAMISRLLDLRPGSAFWAISNPGAPVTEGPRPAGLESLR